MESVQCPKLSTPRKQNAAAVRCQEKAGVTPVSCAPKTMKVRVAAEMTTLHLLGNAGHGHSGVVWAYVEAANMPEMYILRVQ